jgi:ribosomal protein S18 acetylase RimI-like enzyme
MEGLPQNQENQESFEGRVEIDDKKIMLDGKRVGVVALRNHEDYYSVGFITIDENLRGKGLGEIVYRKLVETLDKPLRSDIQLSELGEKLWEKFVRKGLAKQIGTIANGRGLYQWIKE